MDFFALHKLWAGEEGPPVYICDLDPSIARAVGAFSCDVFLSYEDITKLRGSHGIEPQHFALFGIALKYGWVGINPKRPKALLIIYNDQEKFGRYFKAVVKATGEGHELFLETFYPSNVAQFRSDMRRCKVLRDQTEGDETEY